MVLIPSPEQYFPLYAQGTVGEAGRYAARFDNLQSIVNKKWRKDYFLFITRSAAPIIAIIPVSIPDGDLVVGTGTTGAGLAGVAVITVVVALVVAGIATSLADTEGEFPRTSTFCVQS